MSTSTLLLIVFIGLPVLAVLWAILIYNRLVKLKQRVEEGWSGIDVQLKRRANLVGNLVETVKGYAAHERETLESVTETRSRVQAAEVAPAAERAEAENALTVAMGRLFALAESYPDLKADSNYLDLQRTLSDLEDQIQMARRYYNGTAREMNTLVGQFPSNMVARQFGFGEAEYFEIADPAARAVPKVSFS